MLGLGADADRQVTRAPPLRFCWWISMTVERLYPPNWLCARKVEVIRTTLIEHNQAPHARVNYNISQINKIILTLTNSEVIDIVRRIH